MEAVIVKGDLVKIDRLVARLQTPITQSVLPRIRLDTGRDLLML